MSETAQLTRTASADCGRAPDERDLRIVAALASAISIAALIYFYRAGELLLYGDAVAHINIARRVFDSASPGPLQLGTVWLPFPHVAMIPFIVNDWLWRTGIGGAIPSMIAYVLGVLGTFRLVRARASRASGWFAAALYGLNPNLLYMQSTSMNEPIMLALMVWAVLYLDEFARGLLGVSGDDAPASLPPHKAVERCAIVLAAGILTRYDGWVFAFCCGLAVLWIFWRFHKSLVPHVRPVLANVGGRSSIKVEEHHSADRRLLRKSVIEFFLLCALIPTLWLAHNYAISARPLDFLNGPYSAKAIEARTTKPGDPPHPGTHDIKTSAIFYWKCARLNMVESRGSDVALGLLLIVGMAVAFAHLRRYAIWFLLWLPLPFYIYSVSYGSVPIFMPVWWPHSYYNVRYGLEMLAAFSVFAALPIGLLRTKNPTSNRVIHAALAAAFLAILYIPVARATPICLREARVNSTTRIALEARLADVLRQADPNARILMFTGEYVGALQRAGIPLRRVISEAVHPDWDEALSHPATSADIVVAIQGDEVWYATRAFSSGLIKWHEFQTPDKPKVILYKSSARK